MQPVFMLSFDCEGKWGAADCLSAAGYRGLTTADLVTIHRRLDESLARFEIVATFAFVSSHFLTEGEVRAYPDWFAPLPYRGTDWFASFRADMARGTSEGWLCENALEIVRAAGVHEIASHGFSHVPLGRDDVDDDVFQREMTLIRRAEALRGLATDVLVFPRNRVGHLHLLLSNGFRAYRPCAPLDEGGSLLRRGIRFVNDVVPFERPQEHSVPDRPVALPPGRYLVGRTGVRRYIPQSLRIKKFDEILARVVEEGHVFHVFIHPHDLLCQAQFDVFERLLAAVWRRARQGELKVMTLGGYCSALQHTNEDPPQAKIRAKRPGAGVYDAVS